MSEAKVRIQDDLYEAVNGEWLKTAVIPDDRPTAGGFSDLDQDVEKLMMADFRDLAEGKKTTDVPGMDYAISLYRKVLDADRRNREGIAPVLPLLERIRSISSVEELNQAASDLYLQGVELPVQMDVAADMQDATRHSFIVLGPDIILPDTSYYAEDNPAGKQLLALYADMAAKVLAFTPLSPEEQQTYLQDTLAFDALVAKKVKSQLEWAEYTKNHNPMPADEVAACTAPFDLKKFLSDLYGADAPDTLIVYDPRAVKEMSGYFSAENFSLYIHWAYVKALLSATSCLSEELAALGRTYSRALTGVASDPVLEKQAYQTASRMYAHAEEHLPGPRHQGAGHQEALHHRHQDGLSRQHPGDLDQAGLRSGGFPLCRHEQAPRHPAEGQPRQAPQARGPHRMAHARPYGQCLLQPHLQRHHLPGGHSPEALLFPVPERQRKPGRHRRGHRP